MSTHTMHAALARAVPVEREKLGAPYLDIQASYGVHNRYLRVAVFCLCTVIVFQAAGMYKLVVKYASAEPLVVRVNADGSAESAPYASLSYQPQEPEIRHFLTNFATYHYGRVRATARDAFQRKLFFLHTALARSVMEEEKRTDSLVKFLTGNEDDVEVYVTNVAIEDLRQAPYKASAEFEKVYKTAGGGREVKRERYKAHFVFTRMPKVPNNFIPVNPLGLVITYFREDQAF